MVNLTIDGITAQVPDGSTVLQAAEAAGIQIPTLCNHPALKPFGGCRLCLVEVEGARTLQPACTLPASENMVVQTNTAHVRAARKFVLTLIFSDRNHFCPYCQVTGGDCELQNAALAEDMSHWPYQPNWNHLPVDASHEYYVMDHNRCILCHRCVRACGQLVGNFTLGIEERGSKSMLIADTGVPLGESSCVSCGTCVAVCPTGALIERRSAYQGLEKNLEENLSICVGCSVGCGVTLYTRDNRLVRILGDWNAPVNGGVLCKVGRFLPVEEARERITTPMVKKNGQLQPVSWEEALGVLAARLQPLAGKNGEGAAALASTRLPVEALSAFKDVFAGCLGSEMVTSIEEGQYTALSSSLAEELGMPFEVDLEALKTADCVMAFGVNLDENHQVAGFMVKRNLQNGTRLIVVNPDETKLDPLANVVLKAVTGSDLDVVQGIQAGLVKLGLSEGIMMKAEQELSNAAKVTGINEVDLLAAAGILGTANQPVIVYGKDPTAKSALSTLRQLFALGKQTHAGLLGIRGEANSLAAAQLRLEKPFHIDGHQAAFVALGDDTPSQHLLQRLEKAPFLAVQASYVSRLSAAADVVLPVKTWLEQEGHYLNLDGRLQKTTPAINAPDGVLSSVEALEQLAYRLGAPVKEDWQSAICERTAPVKIPA